MSIGQSLWTPEDNRQSFSQGWGLFSTNGKNLVIFGLSEPEEVCAEHNVTSERKFTGPMRDRLAATYVQYRANEGDVLCRKAIEILHLKNSKDVHSFGLYISWTRKVI